MRMKADGVEEGRGPPLHYAVYQQLIFIIVGKTMLGFQLLIVDLIMPNGTLAARTVEVDGSAGAINDRFSTIKTLTRHRAKLLVTVPICRHLIFRDNAIRAHR